MPLGRVGLGCGSSQKVKKYVKGRDGGGGLNKSDLRTSYSHN